MTKKAPARKRVVRTPLAGSQLDVELLVQHRRLKVKAFTIVDERMVCNGCQQDVKRAIELSTPYGPDAEADGVYATCICLACLEQMVAALKAAR